MCSVIWWALTDKQLEELNHRAHEEMKTRAEMKVYPPMTEKEKRMYRDGFRARAVMNYRTRTNHSILEAKTAVEREMK